MWLTRQVKGRLRLQGYSLSSIRPLSSYNRLWGRNEQQKRFSSARPWDLGDASTVEASVKTTRNGSAVSIRFDSNSCESTFHAPWLWSNDPTYTHPSSGQRLRTLGAYPGWKILSADIVTVSDTGNWADCGITRPFPPPAPGCLHSVGTVYSTSQQEQTPNAMLRIKWNTVGASGATADEDESPVSYFDISWLERCQYNEEMIKNRSASTKITKEFAIGRQNYDLHRVEFNHLVSPDDNAKGENDDAVLDTLHAIAEYGAALVQNAPPVESGPNASVAVVGRTLAGSLSHQALYGELFDVRSVANAHNIAYTSFPLQPHQDLAYYESKPGLQLLHCISNIHNGGESTLIDVVAAAEEFRRLAPDHFDTLVQCKATFLKQREGADIVTFQPHIVLDKYGLSADGDNRSNVLAVHWSPPFEGPLVAIPEDKFEEYAVAYAAFERMLDDALPQHSHPDIGQSLEHALRDHAREYTWEYKLQPGEILIFNNQRLLHGRRGFEANDDPAANGSRHLVGCYTNMDETINQYRLRLRERVGRDEVTVRCFGNGSPGSL